jgi:hypothetical protein
MARSSWIERSVNRAERVARNTQHGVRKVRRGVREVKRVYNMPGSGIRGYIAAGKRQGRRR